MSRSRVLHILLGLLLLAGITWAQTPLKFIPTGPCRVMDTRWHNGPFGGPSLAAGSVRTITIPDNRVCSIPNTAQAYALNVTVVPHGYLGYVTIWPTGQTQPLVSTINSIDGRVKAVAALVGGGTGQSLSIYTTNTTDLVLDISGYFVGPGTPNALYYYPLPDYCEVLNTVNPPTPDGLGGPALQSGVPRNFQITTNPNCTIPDQAQAYSLNVIATPVNGTSLGYVTLWPSNQAQPFTSTLNALSGMPVANAAIVGAGGGSISAYASGDTNIEIYINGYFGPAHMNDNGRNYGFDRGDNNSGYVLYTVGPCRANDTRPYMFSNQLDYVPQSQGACVGTLPPMSWQIPPIKAYVLNATVVPEAPLGYLPIWPFGHDMPVPTTVTAVDMAITSNMAIVPTTSYDSEISTFTSAPTNLIYDVFGYFASSQLTMLSVGALPEATEHVPYPAYTMKARGGVPPYTWSAGGQPLPQGFTFSAASGELAGCPSYAGTMYPMFKVQDSTGRSDNSHMVMTINPLPALSITTNHLPNGTLNTPYSVTLGATGGYGAYSWAITSGSLPPGFTLSPSGVLSGYDAGTRGTWHFSVGVSDEQCGSVSTPTQSLTIRID